MNRKCRKTKTHLSKCTTALFVLKMKTYPSTALNIAYI